MTYFPDLAPYVYPTPIRPEHDHGHAPTDGSRLVHVGWLDGKHAFERATSDPAFVDALRMLCVHRADHATRGCHACNLRACPAGDRRGPSAQRQLGVPIEHDGRRRFLGSAELRLRSPTLALTYAAPNLVVHYVEAHRYRPPADFVAAVLQHAPNARDPRHDATWAAPEARFPGRPSPPR